MWYTQAMNEAKKCTRCERVQPLTDFYKDKRATDGRTSDCKACRKTDYEANREQRLAYAKDHHEKNRDKILDYQRAYAEARREEKNAKQRAYHKANPQVAREAAMRRRARKAAADIYDPSLHWTTVAARDGMNCHYCGVLTVPKSDDRKLWPTVDHIIPITRGGDHSMANSVLACQSCNARKGNR